MSPYHPDYGLGDEYRRKVVDDARWIGPSQAAENNSVSLSAVYRWLRDYQGGKK
jgi:hypothetical protein